MANEKSANVTKHDAGGSGDNVISDGYIKTVEKVWIDSYTIAFTALTVATLEIAKLPPNKKIVGIEVDILTTGVFSEGTLSIGFASDASVNSFLTATELPIGLTRCVISLPGPNILYSTATSSTLVFGQQGGFQKVTGGTQTTIALLLDEWTATTGTIKTIVRYT